MNGEKKCLLVTLCLGLLSLAVMVSWLFLALWPLRTLLALGLLGLGALVVLAWVTVTILGRLNEQSLRRQRLRYQCERPLDERGRLLPLPHYDMYQAHAYAPSSYPYPPQGGTSYE
ncbi:MAG TPA: hypothetical protein VEL31_24140 [Ktedonobacteraceae bacterium]|nr:hypothetical protein [Ktedonobacteraceae bacterium]